MLFIINELTVYFYSISWQERKCKCLIIDTQPITDNRDAILLNNYTGCEHLKHQS